MITKYYINPTYLFVLSFLLLISIGTGFLLLPYASSGGTIAFSDAVFMSTSAVCITGLAVFDISKQLSLFGHYVILILIQLGGLGIMTFTGFFGYFLTGRSSFKNQIMFSELMSEKNMSNVLRSLIKIVLLTFFFELMGAILIYASTSPQQFSTNGEHVFFSVFHSISAFCNAGFSTLSAGLYDQSTRFNYPLQLIIAALFILGGMGFAIILNVQVFLKRWAVLLYNRVRHGKAIKYKAWVMTFNSKLIFYTTLILLVFGFVSYFFLEYNNTLAEHPTLYGKMVTAFFAGSTPRTAGFNTVDMTAMSFPAIMIVMLLMWIGASPGSTGGGIRTSTIAVATLNIINTGRNQQNINIYKREISDESVRKSFAIISLSLIWLGISIFLLSLTDGDKGLIALAFESFSAYSTVGLSIGITPSLSTAGKYILASTMFLGRVGTLTLLIALIKNIHPRPYQYPEEHVLF
ncbi:TrkH family potassium uptake protein [Daejeonella oryzae]|uniref:TrkH family potassium uptake protein n=1 Tax=Daejeonella oryzae TaxID=1122943 RepID=UPI000687BC45|nr:potassium transporter TrkG [Daejeonella oryzae]